MDRVAYLFVADGELSLCLLVVLREGLQVLDGLAREDGDGELDVRLGVLVAGLREID